MKRTAQRTGLAAIVMVLFMTLVATPAKATMKVTIGDFSKGTVTLYQYDNYTSGGAHGYVAKGKLTAAKSSNKKVLVVSTDMYEGYTLLHIDTVKAGTAKVTYKYKGKTHKVKVVVKDYICPIEKLTIGKKNYTKQFKKSNIGSASSPTAKKQIVVKPRSGWKLVSIECAGKTIKNKAKLPKTADIVEVTMQSKKTGGTIKLYIG